MRKEENNPREKRGEEVGVRNWVSGGRLWPWPFFLPLASTYRTFRSHRMHWNDTFLEEGIPFLHISILFAATATFHWVFLRQKQSSCSFQTSMCNSDASLLKSCFQSRDHFPFFSVRCYAAQKVNNFSKQQ